MRLDDADALAAALRDDPSLIEHRTPMVSAFTPLEGVSLLHVAAEFGHMGAATTVGQTYELTRTDFEVPFGQTELWRSTTNGNAPHPVHVHGAVFNVLSRCWTAWVTRTRKSTRAMSGWRRRPVCGHQPGSGYRTAASRVAQSQ